MPAPPLSEAELKFLHALSRRGVRFMIVGLSAAALQGAPVVTQDVDLWFEDLGDPHIREALREVGASYVPPMEMNPPMFAGGGVDLFDIVLRMDGLEPFATEFAMAREIRLGTLVVKVLSLPRIIVSKRAANRPKDKLVIQILEDSSAASRETPPKKRRS